MNGEKVYLTLQSGKVFEGKRFGADGDVLGELVFTTGMTGYIETLTDPSYYGQIVIQTFPLIGNYGMISADCESARPYLTGYIVREYCEAPSNFRCEEKIDAYLKEHKIVGIYGIDTRELTKTVREAGVMNAVISSRPVQDIAAIEKYMIRDAVKNCTCGQVKHYGEENAKRTVVLWDFGAKENIVRELVKRGNRVIRVPSTYTAEQILALKPDGLMLTNGVGVRQDYKQAYGWFKKAARQGYAESQNNLGVLYARGLGVEKDYRQAVAWYRKAVMQNLPQAQFNLGTMYLQGHGVKQDVKLARHWFSKAAAQGLPEAQRSLDRMPKNGQTINTDLST